MKPGVSSGVFNELWRIMANAFFGRQSQAFTCDHGQVWTSVSDFYMPSRYHGQVWTCNRLACRGFPFLQQVIIPDIFTVNIWRNVEKMEEFLSHK